VIQEVRDYTRRYVVIRGNTCSNISKLTTKFPTTCTSKNTGTHKLDIGSSNFIQSHMVSIHSPQRIRKTIKNECSKSRMCHRFCNTTCATRKLSNLNKIYMVNKKTLSELILNCKVVVTKVDQNLIVDQHNFRTKYLQSGEEN